MSRRNLFTASAALLSLTLCLSARSVRKSNGIDLSKSIVVSSRIPCDGHTAPQDQVYTKATFSEGATQRTFTLSEYQKGGCKVDLKIHCVDKVPTGWRQDWAASSVDEPHPSQLSIDSCYEWGSPEPAQYVISGWYKPAGATKKTPWIQATVKKVSSTPEIFEFTDGNGGTGRLELDRR